MKILRTSSNSGVLASLLGDLGTLFHGSQETTDAAPAPETPNPDASETENGIPPEMEAQVFRACWLERIDDLDIAATATNIARAYKIAMGPARQVARLIQAAQVFTALAKKSDAAFDAGDFVKQAEYDYAIGAARDHAEEGDDADEIASEEYFANGGKDFYDYAPKVQAADASAFSNTGSFE